MTSYQWDFRTGKVLLTSWVLGDLAHGARTVAPTVTPQSSHMLKGIFVITRPEVAAGLFEILDKVQ